MSEDECRLTYREGKGIEKEAMKPYEDHAVILFGMGVVTFILSFAISLLEKYFDLGGHKNLDMLLANGDITQGLHDYIITKLNAELPLFGATLFVMSAIGAFILITIGDIEGKKALKKANDEKGSE